MASSSTTRRLQAADASESSRHSARFIEHGRERLGTDIRPLDRLEIQLHDRSSSTLDGDRSWAALDGYRITIGKDADNDIVVPGDPSVSHYHAVLERVGDRWSIQDLGSTAGVLVNGARIFGEHWLRDDDEVILGRTRLRFCARGAPESPNENVLQRPRLTPRERVVLIELCRPVFSAVDDVVTKPATVREIAERLFVSDAVVKQHFTYLFDRFGVDNEGSFESRCVRLVTSSSTSEGGTTTAGAVIASRELHRRRVMDRNLSAVARELTP